MKLRFAYIVWSMKEIDINITTAHIFLCMYVTHQFWGGMYDKK